MTASNVPAWSDRHCLVTGGGRGIGRAVTQALLGAGARVTMLGRQALEAQALAALAAHLDVVQRLHAMAADVVDAQAAAITCQATSVSGGEVM